MPIWNVDKGQIFEIISLTSSTLQQNNNKLFFYVGMRFLSI